MTMSNQTQTMDGVLTPEQVAQYEQEGYVVVPNLLDAELAQAWKSILKQRLAEEGKLDEPSGVRVWMSDQMDPFTRSRVLDTKIGQILQQLIGPNIEFLSVKAVFKNAKTTFNSPWHQDWFYWQGSNKISIWIALDDATPENGCLRMIPGTHRQLFEMTMVEDGPGFNRQVSDEALHGLPIETLPVRRGDAVFFHDLALHGSTPNINGADRWSAIATYRDAGQQDDSTVWRTALVMSGTSVNV
jgi:phytanoyl-CoA hydroxylase